MALPSRPSLSALDKISRFEDTKHLVGYAGLGGRVHSSGQRKGQGSITKTVGTTCARPWWWRPGMPAT